MLDAQQKMKLLISNRPWEHEPDNEEWVFGFDCSHAGDFSPKLVASNGKTIYIDD
jgi:hypothetical protein